MPIRLSPQAVGASVECQLQRPFSLGLLAPHARSRDTISGPAPAADRVMRLDLPVDSAVDHSHLLHECAAEASTALEGFHQVQSEHTWCGTSTTLCRAPASSLQDPSQRRSRSPPCLPGWSPSAIFISAVSSRTDGPREWSAGARCAASISGGGTTGSCARGDTTHGRVK